MREAEVTRQRSTLAVTPNDQAYELTGRPHISFSEIKTYQSCPLRWHFQYVERAEPEQISAAMLLGSWVHVAVQEVMEALLAFGPLPTVDELMESFEPTLEREARSVRIQFASGQDIETLRTAGRHMLETFLGSELALPEGEIIGIEESFRVHLSNDLPDLAGRIDLLTLQKGVLTLTDFKTVRAIPSESTADAQGDQLILYAHGCEQLARELDASVSLRFVYISKTKVPRVDALPVTLDRTAISRTTEIVRQVFKGMRAGVVYPAPSPVNCVGCPFQNRCKGWQRIRA